MLEYRVPTNSACREVADRIAMLRYIATHFRNSRLSGGHLGDALLPAHTRSIAELAPRLADVDSEGFPDQAEHLSRYGRLTLQVEKVPEEAHYPCEHPGHAERDRLVSRLDATCCQQIAEHAPERSFFIIRHEVDSLAVIHRQQKRVDKIVDVTG